MAWGDPLPKPPQPYFGGWGEGFEAPDYYYDEWGRKYDAVQNGWDTEYRLRSDSYATSSSLNEAATQPLYVPQQEAAKTVDLSTLFPESFYGADEFSGQMVGVGADPFVTLGLRGMTSNPNEYQPDFFSNHRGDYIAGSSMDGDFNSLWGQDGEIVRKQVQAIGEQLGMSYPEIRAAAEQALATAKTGSMVNSYGQSSKYGYHMGTNPLQIVQSIADNMFAAKGMQSTALYTPAQMAEADQAAYQRREAARDARGGGFFEDFAESAMGLLSSPGFSMLMGFGAPMLSAYAAATAGAGQIGSGIGAAASTSGSFSAPFASSTAITGLNTATLGAGSTLGFGSGLLVPAGSTALVSGLANGFGTTGVIGEGGMALGADAFAPMADSTVWGGADLSLAGDYTFGGEGLKMPSGPNLDAMGGGQGVRLGSAPSLSHMGGGQGLTGYDPYTGNTIGETGVSNPESMLNRAMPYNGSSPSLWDQFQDRPDWVDEAARFGYDAFSSGYGAEGDSGYTPEVTEDTGGLFQDEAIFRSGKSRRGTPGTGFTTFQVGSPGLFIP